MPCFLEHLWVKNPDHAKPKSPKGPKKDMSGNAVFSFVRKYKLIVAKNAHAFTRISFKGINESECFPGYKSSIKYNLI
jgi:hypothetical protein